MCVPKRWICEELQTCQGVCTCKWNHIWKLDMLMFETHCYFAHTFMNVQECHCVKQIMESFLQVCNDACHLSSWVSVWVLSQKWNAWCKGKGESLKVSICWWYNSVMDYAPILRCVQGTFTLLTFSFALTFQIFIFVFET